MTMNTRSAPHPTPDPEADNGSSRHATERSTTNWRWSAFLSRVVTAYVLTSVVLVGIGFLIVHPLRNSGLVRWDAGAVRWFANHRTSGLTRLSAFWSKSGDAPTIVAVGVVVAIILAVRRHWHEIAVLGMILAVELGTFLTISYAVGRKRPTVVHLGSVPSTGSFPSGHIAATIVLYGFVVLLLHRFAVPSFLQAIASVWAVVAAASVGWARMYRGMHHPLDVAAGAVMGIAVLVGFALALRTTRRGPQPYRDHTTGVAS